MSIADAKKLVAALALTAAAYGANHNISRITHCIDCNRKISTARRWQTNCQRCRQCAIRFERQQFKRGKV